jgi:hypothetical protein
MRPASTTFAGRPFYARSRAAAIPPSWGGPADRAAVPVVDIRVVAIIACRASDVRIRRRHRPRVGATCEHPVEEGEGPSGARRHARHGGLFCSCPRRPRWQPLVRVSSAPSAPVKLVAGSGRRNAMATHPVRAVPPCDSRSACAAAPRGCERLVDVARLVVERLHPVERQGQPAGKSLDGTVCVPRRFGQPVRLRWTRSRCGEIPRRPQTGRPARWLAVGPQERGGIASAGRASIARRWGSVGGKSRTGATPAIAPHLSGARHPELRDVADPDRTPRHAGGRTAMSRGRAVSNAIHRTGAPPVARCGARNGR